METSDRIINILRIINNPDIKQFSKEFTEISRKFLYDKDYNVRTATLNVIKNINENGVFIKDLFELLSHTKNEDEKILVLNVLSSSKEHKEEIINKVFNSYYNWSPKVKAEALKTLSVIGEKNEKVKQYIYDTTKEETLEPVVRYGAIQALANWKDVKSISNFLIQQKESKILLNAIYTLGELGKEGEKYLSNFAVENFKYSSSEIKMASILSLFKTGYKEINGLIISVLVDGEKNLSNQVIDFLAQNINGLKNPEKILAKLLNIPIADEWVKERIGICFAKCLDSQENTVQYKILRNNLLISVSRKFLTIVKDFLAADLRISRKINMVSIAMDFIQKYGNVKLNNQLWNYLTSMKKTIPSDIRKELFSLHINRKDIKGFETLLSIMSGEDLKIKAALSVELKNINVKKDDTKDLLILLLDIISKLSSNLSRDIYNYFKKIYKFSIKENDTYLFKHITMTMAKTVQPGFVQEVKKALNYFDDISIKNHLILVLSEINKEAALDTLIDIIKQKNQEEEKDVVVLAVRSLIKFGEKYSAKISQVLFDIIKTKSVHLDIRIAALEAIVQLKRPNKNLIEYLEAAECLDDENEIIRKSALTSVGIFFEKCPEYIDQKHLVSILQERFNDSSVWVRILVLVMLLKIKEEGHLIEKVKKMVLEFTNYEVTTKLVNELIPLKSLKICLILLPLLDSPNNEVVESVINAISNLDKKDMMKILPRLEALLIKGENRPVVDKLKTVTGKLQKPLMETGYSYSDIFKHTTMMTVLFADLKGSVALSKKLSYVRYMEILHRYHNNAISIAKKYNSKFNKTIGDGLMCTFDNAVDGVVAATEIRNYLAQDNQYRFEDEKLNVRLGLNSGLVWLKEDGDVEGQSVNIASRMESNATVGNILITEDTYNDVKDSIKCEKLPLIKVKGIDEPVQCYQVIEPTVEIAPSDPINTLSFEEIEFTINKYDDKISKEDDNKLDNIKNIVRTGIVNIYKLIKMETKNQKLLQNVKNYINDEFWKEFIKNINK